jgi:hypothetical protein
MHITWYLACLAWRGPLFQILANITDPNTTEVYESNYTIGTLMLITDLN